jgi:hypothetical protein
LSARRLVAAPAIAQLLKRGDRIRGLDLLARKLNLNPRSGRSYCNRQIVGALERAQARHRFVDVALSGEQLRLIKARLDGFAWAKLRRELVERVIGARKIALCDAGLGAREPRFGLPRIGVIAQHALRSCEIVPGTGEIAKPRLRHAAPQRRVRIGAERAR